jgi:hypothetical protein
MVPIVLTRVDLTRPGHAVASAGRRVIGGSGGRENERPGNLTMGEGAAFHTGMPAGSRNKARADELPRRVIEWSGASRSTSLRHDAAEAILIGRWGVLEAGWLDRVPGCL